MKEALLWILLLGCLVFLPPLLIGCIRKTKATLQNRIGASVCQPLMDLAKFLAKGELLSDSASWVLRWSAVGSAAVTFIIGLTSPWVSGMPHFFQMDIFLFVYLFVLLRFLMVLSSLDAASPFGGFAASREVTIAVLVEPAIMLCLTALAVVANSTDMSIIFGFSDKLARTPGLWLMAGCGLYLASLVELSRMPADDPTTHLELTMVHEAMIIENSGPNLALMEYSSALKLLILMGVAGQCFLHAIQPVWHLSAVARTACGFVALLAMVLLTALVETTAVKLRWTKLPEFIAYAVTFGLLCAVYSLGAPR